MSGEQRVLICKVAYSESVAEDLVHLLSHCGNLLSLTVVPDKSDDSKSVVIVEFENERSAKIALLLNGTIYFSTPMSIQPAPSNFVVPPNVYSEPFPRRDDADELTPAGVMTVLLTDGYSLSEEVTRKYGKLAAAQANPLEPLGGPTHNDSELTGPFSPSTAVAMADRDKFQKMYKVITIGDSGVGKTNILSRWLKDVFVDGAQATVACVFFNKYYRVDNEIVNVQLWDTAGQERFRAITSQYYRGISGCVIVYDVTRPSSFESVKVWLEEVRQVVGDPGQSNIQYLLIGNKTDLVDEIVVPTSEGLKFAQQNQMAFMETSALDGSNCMKALQILMQDIHAVNSRNVLEGGQANTTSHSAAIRIDQPPPKQKEDDCPC